MTNLIAGIMACLPNIFQTWVIMTKVAGYHNLIKELSAISLIASPQSRRLHVEQT